MAKGKGRAYEGISDEAADRILSQIDTSGDWHDVRKRLVKRFPKWSAYQRDRMAARVMDRRIEVEEFKAGKVTRSYTKMAVDAATGPGGNRRGHYKMIRDVSGKLLGRPGNVKIVTRKGTDVWAKNILTGRIARIK